MLISRRNFLKLCGALIASGVNITAFATPRDPYVKVGEVVNYIGHHPGGFIGGELVAHVFDWDGVGYPVVFNQKWKKTPSPTYYDFDLANFTKDIPRDFWHNGQHEEYSNVHTWIRTQRFGETIEEAEKHLNFVSTRIKNV